MIFYLLAILFLIFSDADLYGREAYNHAYLSRNNTNAVKGIFGLMIFFRHASQYVTFDGVYDQTFVTFSRFLDQTIVCAFLFYSGYGICEAIRKKGRTYVLKMPLHRLLPTLVNFDIAVLIFLVINMSLGARPRKSTILWSLIGWRSVGNSNWYIFAILISYLLTYIAFLISKREKLACVLVIIGVTLYTVYLYRLMPNQTWWYNTIYCYPLGMVYSIYREKLEEKIFSLRSYQYSLLVFCALVLLCAVKPYRRVLWIYEIWSVLFTLILILLTMKVNIHNKYLIWIGQHTFEFYILQRLPMLVLEKLGFTPPYAFFIVSFLVLHILIYGFSKITSCVTRICKAL